MAAHEVAGNVRSYLCGLGWPSATQVSSGNGFHLLFKANWCPPGSESFKLALKSLAAQFNTDAVKVDTSVFNAGRIARLPHTMNRKGDNSEDRPHRLAKVLAAGSLDCVTEEQLSALARLHSSAIGRTAPPAEEAPVEVAREN